LYSVNPRVLPWTFVRWTFPERNGVRIHGRTRGFIYYTS